MDDESRKNLRFLFLFSSSLRWTGEPDKVTSLLSLTSASRSVSTEKFAPIGHSNANWNHKPEIYMKKDLHVDDLWSLIIPLPPVGGLDFNLWALIKLFIYLG